MYKNIKQVLKLLSFQKKKLYILIFCLFIAIFLESMSIGIVLPIVLFISDPSQLNDYSITLKMLEMGYNSGQIILILVILLLAPENNESFNNEYVFVKTSSIFTP